MGVRISAIIYCRLSSRRLPNKALLSLGESSLIENVIKSAQKLNIDDLIIATSNDKSDDLLEQVINSIAGTKIYRGSLTDVSDRTVACIDKYKSDYFIRINSDSPILPIELINEQINIIREDKELKFDIISNLIERSFPYGYSIEIIKSESFRKFQICYNEDEKEHITKYFYKNLKKINAKSIISTHNHSDITLTIDDAKSYYKMYTLFKKTDILNLKLEQIINIYND